jgi:hypothetical protein
MASTRGNAPDWPAWLGYAGVVIASLLLLMRAWEGAVDDWRRVPPVQAASARRALAIITARAEKSAAREAAAVELLGAAIFERQQGNIDVALDLAKQAQTIWPEYADARVFLNELARAGSSP